MARARKLLRRIGEHPYVAWLTARVAGVERMTLIALIFVASVLWAFAELADEVGEGGTRAFDEWLLLALRVSGNPADPIGPKWFEEMMRDFTALGSTGVLTVVVVAVAGLLAMIGKKFSALFVMVSVVGGVVISQTMKWAYARPRPELVPHGAEVYSASFPSGHSMMAAVVYLTLGALLARTQPGRAAKIYVLSLAVAVAALVGVSRIYLGVHWPTDVLAGWTLGAAWALMCGLAMTWLQARGQVEREGEGKSTREGAGRGEH